MDSGKMGSHLVKGPRFGQMAGNIKVCGSWGSPLVKGSKFTQMANKRSVIGIKESLLKEVTVLIL